MSEHRFDVNTFWNLVADWHKTNPITDDCVLKGKLINDFIDSAIENARVEDQARITELEEALIRANEILGKLWTQPVNPSTIQNLGEVIQQALSPKPPHDTLRMVVNRKVREFADKIILPGVPDELPVNTNERITAGWITAKAFNAKIREELKRLDNPSDEDGRE